MRLRNARRRRGSGSWWRRPLLRIVALASGAVALVLWQSSILWLFPGSEVVPGRSLDGRSVVDGDTLRIGDRRIRLHGIDAPELDQTCADGWPAGEMARRALAAIVAARPLECRSVTTDAYGRTVAACRVDGADVGAALVRSGMAVAYGASSLGYLLPEWQARFDGLGVHAHPCIGPSAWRDGARR